MNRILLFLSFFVATITAKSEDYIESFNIISDNYINDVQDAQVIRHINGGTVITPLFDASCPEEMKAPFSYACKIVEEYMPPCLPLNVKVSCGRVNSSANGAISKVLVLSQENFGASSHYHNAPMSVIKGVILDELCHNSTVTYFDSIPNIEFLTKKPDIEITYNDQKLDEIYFSLDTIPGEKYDFVSLAIRDILIGLGFYSGYRYNPVSNGLLNPYHKLTPFEDFIDRMLGNYGNPTARLVNATKGELLLKEFSIKTLKLYAPSTWQNGISLNYFIPQDDSSVSKILSHNFCKGMVTRSLSDDYADFIFYNLLGWKPNYVTSISTPSYGTAGSTSLLMPYNGSISFNNNTYGISMVVDSNSSLKRAKAFSDEDREELYNYIESFHPFLYEGNDIPKVGTSISVLKKDGSWDLVKYLSSYFDTSFNMSDWEFHYDEEQYARTIDGYLKARITVKKPDNSGRIHCNSTFFVIDYLPQKINLSFAFVKSASTKSAISTTSNNTIRIYFSNTEGLNRIVLERLRQGARLPSKIEISDIKKGYFETTVDRTTKFTAVGYNDNGISRSLPITVTPISNEPSLNFRLKDNCIFIESEGQPIDNYNYTIIPASSTSIVKLTGSTSGSIDISTLSEGLYILTINDNNLGLSSSFKFKR